MGGGFYEKYFDNFQEKYDYKIITEKE